MPYLRNLSIKAKLSAGFGLSLGLIFAIGAISIVQLWGINALALRVTEVWLPQMETLGDVKRAMAEHNVLARRRTITTNFRQIALDSAKLQDVQAAFDARVDRLASLLDEQGGRELFDRFRIEWNAYLQSLETVFSRLDAGDPGSAQDEFDTSTNVAFAAAARTVDDLIAAAAAEGSVATENVRSVYGLSLVLIIAVIAFAALTVGGAIRWISRNVSRPILMISAAMQRLTAGDKSVSVLEGMERKDEIGVLVGAVTSYRESLDRIHQLADEADRERNRLDTALTNMSQGLCMFDSEGKLVIFNKRFAEVYGIPMDRILPGMTTPELMQLAQQYGVKDVDPDGTIAAGQGMLVEKRAESGIQRLTDGRSISISSRAMQGGGFVATFEDITGRLLAEEKIKYLAHFDALTDLPNRASFQEQIASVVGRLRRSETLAVLSIDLDDFKSVNDTLGHPVGDALLKAVAGRMRSCIREEDIVARLGGDEFAIVQVPTEEPGDITALAVRLIEAVSAPYDIGGHQVVVGTSVGIALAPHDGVDPEILMKNADLALYRAKSDGGGVYRFFEIAMDERMQARRKLELDLRRAITVGEFELVYQPIIDVKSRRITSCEALIRWNHPTRGSVPPLDFIPVAEETGLIVPIGEWVLRQACAEAARWPQEVTVAVNVSPAQFKNRNLVPAVLNALATSGLPASRLELEITEMVLLQDNEGAFTILHQLRNLGIKIAMDDFGTGYSSLGYLRSFPFDKIKIDQSFIHDLPSEGDSVAIVRAVVGLSSSLGITTTAEGVETREQLASLSAEGCNEMQGFLFSRPKPAAEVQQLLREQTPRAAAVA